MKLEVSPKEKKMKKVMTAVLLSPEVDARIVEIAKREKASKSQVVRTIIEKVIWEVE